MTAASEVRVFVIDFAVVLPGKLSRGLAALNMLKAQNLYVNMPLQYMYFTVFTLGTLTVASACLSICLIMNHHGGSLMTQTDIGYQISTRQ